MKKLLFISLFLISILSTVSAQLPTGGGTYKFITAYDSDGNEIEDAVHPSKISVVVLTTNFFGIAQTGASYSEFNTATGMFSGNIIFDSYRGIKNGWFIYSWNGNVLYIRNDFSRIRVAMSWYNGNFYEYRKMLKDEDINDAATY